ncbi:hypothetical protein BJX99DRAFT_255315 [Aspergillus californicus]
MSQPAVKKENGFSVRLVTEEHHTHEKLIHPQHWWLHCSPEDRNVVTNNAGSYQMIYTIREVVIPWSKRIEGKYELECKHGVPNTPQGVEWEANVCTFERERWAEFERIVKSVEPQRCQSWVIAVLEKLVEAKFAPEWFLNHWRDQQEKHLWGKFDPLAMTQKGEGSKLQKSKCCY